MAIQTVTNANLAEFAAGRTPAPSLTSAEAVTQEVTKTDAPTPGNPVIKETVEKLPGTPDPGPQPDGKAPKKAKSNVQDRIDELVKERHELDEAFQSEYEQRLRLEGELQAVRSQQQPKPEPKDEPKAEPKPEDYTDQKAFLADWGKWNRDKAKEEFAAEQLKAKQAEDAKRAEAAMVEKIARATADFPDFPEVLAQADRRPRPPIPPHIKAAFHDSDWGGHLAYHLMKDPAEEKRIFGLPVAKALLELGKIEDTFARKGTTIPEGEKPSIPTPETKQVPQPLAKLGEGSGIATVDLTQPMSFPEYRKHRIQEMRAQGRRRH